MVGGVTVGWPVLGMGVMGALVVVDTVVMQAALRSIL